MPETNEPIANVVDPKTRRLITGFATRSSCTTNHTMATAAATMQPTIKPESSHSSSCPLSSSSCSAPMPRNEERHAAVVDLPGAALDVGRIEDEELQHDQRQHADRHVDVEHPAPAVGQGEVAADHRSHDRREHDADRPEAHRPPALVRRESFEHHRLRERHHHAAGEPLDDAEHDQDRERRRQAAEERRRREGEDAPDHQPLAAEVIGEPTGERQDHRVGGEIRGERPGRLVDRRRQAAGDVRQRHVHHRGVEEHHERRQHHRAGDHPAVGLGGREDRAVAHGAE